jgi:hypothetical protein
MLFHSLASDSSLLGQRDCRGLAPMRSADMLQGAGTVRKVGQGQLTGFMKALMTHQ